MRGSFRKHPERRAEREDEPEVTRKLGKPPEHLDEAERACWAELRRWCPWLTIADRWSAERACRIMVLDRKGRATDTQAKQLDSILSKLGMNPIDRTKVKAPKEADKGDAKRERYFGSAKA